ncbi:MAG: type II toxin-antitoxin system HicA family toxin [Burkholderiales bacterium]|jgi:predicted RNA binding protein YcfA (HicA-like mRNA interferase family)|nr:type II toxin-antitoxin system HicA family toxin [Burkholderiales bacterium]
MSSRELLRRLQRDGWVIWAVRGSHHVLRHPCKPGHISLPHPKKDLGIGLVRKLLIQAGIESSAQ